MPMRTVESGVKETMAVYTGSVVWVEVPPVELSAAVLAFR